MSNISHMDNILAVPCEKESPRQDAMHRSGGVLVRRLFSCR